MARKKRRGGRSSRCTFCERKTCRPRYVNLNEGDGCFNVPVCQKCMTKNGWINEQQIEGAP